MRFAADCRKACCHEGGRHPWIEIAWRSENGTVPGISPWGPTVAPRVATTQVAAGLATCSAVYEPWLDLRAADTQDTRDSAIDSSPGGESRGDQFAYVAAGRAGRWVDSPRPSTVGGVARALKTERTAFRRSPSPELVGQFRSTDLNRTSSDGSTRSGTRRRAEARHRRRQHEVLELCGAARQDDRAYRLCTRRLSSEVELQ